MLCQWVLLDFWIYFDEILSIIDFDNKVKALLYPQVMFIETALKSYVLEIIIQNGKTENFSQIYANLMTDYKSYSNQSDRYKNAYKKRLDTYNRIQNAITHNNVIFDTRFRNININTTLLKSLCRDTNIQWINFTSISDYMILVIYILKKLNKTNKELTKVINDFIKTIDCSFLKKIAKIM